eukprot:4458042-Amphidinium_carterae.1
MQRVCAHVITRSRDEASLAHSIAFLSATCLPNNVTVNSQSLVRTLTFAVRDPRLRMPVVPPPPMSVRLAKCIHTRTRSWISARVPLQVSARTLDKRFTQWHYHACELTTAQEAFCVLQLQGPNGPYHVIRRKHTVSGRKV